MSMKANLNITNLFVAFSEVQNGCNGPKY